MMTFWEISKAIWGRKLRNESKKDPHAHVRRLQGAEAEEGAAPGKKSGRGVYVCDDIECFTKAYESHGLERSLKRPVSKDVYDALKEQIENG